jgi:hypothetical protein
MFLGGEFEQIKDWLNCHDESGSYIMGYEKYPDIHVESW